MAVKLDDLVDCVLDALADADFEFPMMFEIRNDTLLLSKAGHAISMEFDPEEFKTIPAPEALVPDLKAHFGP